jgi:adenosylcobinamide kinase / adenosylcobinamide-phosphate guanylyltransferase
MGELILITGGARSGKSTFAEKLAQKLGGSEVLFVATAEAGDDDMARRIAAHRQSRPPAWSTEETPRDVGRALLAMPRLRPVVLVDCLTLLVSNAVLSLGDSPPVVAAEALVDQEVSGLIEASTAVSRAMIVVTNEVGLGLVPPNALGRLFRDLLGKANQRLAAHSSAVYALFAGIPIDLKQMAADPPSATRRSSLGEDRIV